MNAYQKYWYRNITFRNVKGEKNMIGIVVQCLTSLYLFLLLIAIIQNLYKSILEKKNRFSYLLGAILVPSAIYFIWG